jgi:hypothetical protein
VLNQRCSTSVRLDARLLRLSLDLNSCQSVFVASFLNHATRALAGPIGAWPRPQASRASLRKDVCPYLVLLGIDRYARSLEAVSRLGLKTLSPRVVCSGSVWPPPGGGGTRRTTGGPARPMGTRRLTTEREGARKESAPGLRNLGDVGDEGLV